MTARRIAPALLSTLVIGCAAVPENSTDRQTEDLEDTRQDIVGGQATSSFASVGALTRFGGTHCTGTLIAPRRVATAAHCLQGVSASSLRFVLGSNVWQPEASLTVASVHPHPDYNDFSLDNDIGYVELAQDAPAPPMTVLPAMDSSFVGQELVFVGYGASNGFSQTGSGTKRYVTMAVSQVMATQFSYAVPNKNTCNGDSGGPAFAQIGGELLLAGVTSYGDANCVQYGVDTRTDVYADFLGVGGQAQDPCNGETYVGRCEGNSVVWCENEQVQMQPCGTDKVCGFSEDKQYYACVDAPVIEEDPCDGETFEGRCDGNTVIWCEDEEVKSIECQQCGFDSAKGYYNCL